LTERTAAARVAEIGQAVSTVASRLPWAHIFAAVAAALLLLTLLLRYLLVDLTQINWDEFNFLRSVYVTASGEQTKVLQTAHGHLFSWLPWLGGNEVDRIVVGRRVMFALAAVTAVAMALVGKRLIGGSAGLFAAFVYGAFAYVLHHGTAFRYDPLLVACYLGGAAALLATGRPRLTGAVAGLLGAAALIISIKSVFLLIPLGALAALPLLDAAGRRRDLERLASFVATGVLSTGVFYVLHRLSLAELGNTATAAAATAADRVINFDDPLKRVGYLVASLRWEPFKWVLILVGLVLAGGDLAHRSDRADRVRALQLLALATPLLTIYFYRNSYPYFYVTILPGACLLAGCVWRRLELWRSRPILAAALALVVALPVARSAWRWYAHNSDDATSDQRGLLQTVHAMFPEPVPYIDRCGMVSSFEKVGPFMSTWGMSAYRRGRANLFPQLLREKQPRFVLANSPALDLSRAVRHIPRGYRWRPGDYQQLRENFVHFWGPIWLAGKSVTLERGERAEIEIYVPGTYTLESKQPVEIDGALLEPGGAIELPEGTHVLAAVDGTKQPVTLRWGAEIPRPRGNPRSEFAFEGFGLDPPPRE
jgi:hypothetical protein